MQLSRKTVLLLCAVVVTLTSSGMNSFSLFLRPIEAQFAWSRAMATVPYMVAMIGWGAGAVLFGKFADDFGARRVILAGICLMAAGFFGMGLSQNLWQLSLSYGVMVGMAMGACGLVIVSLLISKHFDIKSRGLAVSVIQTAPPLSPLLFAPLLYFLIKTFDWRAAAMATGVALFAVALPLAWLGAREPHAASAVKRQRATWGECIPYLRNRSMLSLFAARFSCGVGTLLLALDIPNEILFYVVIALSMGPTFGTVAVQNVMFYELVGARMAGVILGLSFIVHQIGSAGGPMLASIVFDMTGSYDGFLLAMGVILLASAVLIYGTINSDMYLPERVMGASSIRP